MKFPMWCRVFLMTLLWSWPAGAGATQNDYDIPDEIDGLKAQVQGAMDAIKTNNSGTSAPTINFPFEFWVDETNEVLYIRDKDNSSTWHRVGDISTDDLGHLTGQIVTGEITNNAVTSDKLASGSVTSGKIAAAAVATSNLAANAVTREYKCYDDGADTVTSETWEKVEFDNGDCSSNLITVTPRNSNTVLFITAQIPWAKTKGDDITSGPDEGPGSHSCAFRFIINGTAEGNTETIGTSATGTDGAAIQSTLVWSTTISAQTTIGLEWMSVEPSHPGNQNNGTCHTGDFDPSGPATASVILNRQLVVLEFSK